MPNDGPADPAFVAVPDAAIAPAVGPVAAPDAGLGGAPAAG